MNDVDFQFRHFSRSQEVLGGLCEDKNITKLIDMLRSCRERDATAWFFGNGGKAAIASEFANDLSGGVACKPAFRCQSLCENTTMLTALANDHSYEEIFSRQLEIYAQPGDLAVGMSGSGHSKNVIQGLRQARTMGLSTAMLVGMDGGEMLRLHQEYNYGLAIHIPTATTEDGLIEDAMLAICHLCVMRFRDEFCS